MMPDLPHAPATARNREPILAVLQPYLHDRDHLLEIGSGTGEHAVCFAAAMPWLTWQCSEVPGRLDAVHAWLAHASLPNTPAPLALDVRERPWPVGGFDAVFTANTLHIMGWDAVEALFAALPAVTREDAVLIVYGPFHYGGRPTSDSNAAFDRALRATDPAQGVRDFEAVDALARRAGFALVDDVAMPANNRTLVWRRTAAQGSV